jgi:hypothetical protein
MCAVRKPSLDSYFPKSTKSRLIPGGEESKDLSMSKKQFERMHQHFHFHIQQFDLFNKKFESFVCCLFFFHFFLVLFSDRLYRQIGHI